MERAGDTWECEMVVWWENDYFTDTNHGGLGSLNEGGGESHQKTFKMLLDQIPYRTSGLITLNKCFNSNFNMCRPLSIFFTTGTTYLLPKTEQFTEHPAKYRTITCLSTIYKIVTSIPTSKVYTYLEENKLLDEEQKISITNK